MVLKYFELIRIHYQVLSILSYFFSISMYPLDFESVIFKVIASKGKYLSHVRTRSILGIPVVVDPLIEVVLDLNW